MITPAILLIKSKFFVSSFLSRENLACEFLIVVNELLIGTSVEENFLDVAKYSLLTEKTWEKLRVLMIKRFI